jgi:hypothetical protein
VDDARRIRDLTRVLDAERNTARERIAKLVQQLDQERQRRIAAERRAGMLRATLARLMAERRQQEPPGQVALPGAETPAGAPEGRQS